MFCDEKGDKGRRIDRHILRGLSMKKLPHGSQRVEGKTGKALNVKKPSKSRESNSLVVLTSAPMLSNRKDDGRYRLPKKPVRKLR